MDYIFTPLSADRFVVESTLKFVTMFRDRLMTTGPVSYTHLGRASSANPAVRVQSYALKAVSDRCLTRSMTANRRNVPPLAGEVIPVSYTHLFIVLLLLLLPTIEVYSTNCLLKHLEKQKMKRKKL